MTALKKFMLQPSNNNNHIHDSTDKADIQYFFYHNIKSKYVIYLIKCILWKTKKVEKAGTAFNLRLNNHRKGTKKPDSILACKYFQQQGYNFNKNAKFIIIDKLVHLHSSKETSQELLVLREKFLDSEDKNISFIWS